MAQKYRPTTQTSRTSSIAKTESLSRLYAGQHLLDVFVCHVESYARIYVMFGDGYLRATRLFQAMNTCSDLMRPRNIAFKYVSSMAVMENDLILDRPKENDLIAVYHEKKWFRGRCINATGTNIKATCIDSGATVVCSSESKSAAFTLTRILCSYPCRYSAASGHVSFTIVTQIYAYMISHCSRFLISNVSTMLHPMLAVRSTNVDRHELHTGYDSR